MNPAERRIILVTGMMSSGKSSVAQALAELLHPSMHLRGNAVAMLLRIAELVSERGG